MKELVEVGIKLSFCLCVAFVQVVLEIAPYAKQYAQNRLCEVDLGKTINDLKTEKEFLDKLITKESVAELQRMQATSCQQIKIKK